MDKELQSKLESLFKTEKFKEIYLEFLKFFKNLDDNLENPALIRTMLNSVIKNIERISLDEKERVLEESITLIYQKAEIFDEKDVGTAERKIFFKKQIKLLLTRELKRLLLLLKLEKFNDLLSKLLPVLFNIIEVKARTYIPEIFNLFKNQNITKTEFKLLINPFLDRFPNDALDILVELLTEIYKGQEEKSLEKEIEAIYWILADYSDIYPEVYLEKFEFFLDNLQKSMNIKANYSLNIAQIINNSIQERPELFTSKYFNILFILSKLNQFKKKEIMYPLEISLKSIFSKDTSGIFDLFRNNYNSELKVFLNQMIPEAEALNDIIYEFFIDYLNHIKFHDYRGKIALPLLEKYLEILEYIQENNLMNEYFLFSTIKQLNLDNFEIATISDKLKNNPQRLEEFYQDVISVLKDFIKIIYNQ